MPREDNFSVLEKINCVIHWYQIWNQNQRQLFLNLIVQRAFFNHASPVAGLLHSFEQLGVDTYSKNVSIFESQRQILKNWIRDWTAPELDFLIERIEACDPGFIASFNERLSRVRDS